MGGVGGEIGGGSWCLENGRSGFLVVMYWGCFQECSWVCSEQSIWRQFWLGCVWEVVVGWFVSLNTDTSSLCGRERFHCWCFEKLDYHHWENQSGKMILWNHGDLLNMCQDYCSFSPMGFRAWGLMAPNVGICDDRECCYCCGKWISRTYMLQTNILMNSMALLVCFHFQFPFWLPSPPFLGPSSLALLLFIPRLKPPTSAVAHSQERFSSSFSH